MDDYDLIVAIGLALRDAHRQGNDERERTLYATLAQELHSLGLRVDPKGEALGAIIRSNGYLDPAALARIGVWAS